MRFQVIQSTVGKRDHPGDRSTQSGTRRINVKPSTSSTSASPLFLLAKSPSVRILQPTRKPISTNNEEHRNYHEKSEASARRCSGLCGHHECELRLDAGLASVARAQS